MERRIYRTGKAVKTNIRDGGKEGGQKYCRQNLSSSQILTLYPPPHKALPPERENAIAGVKSNQHLFPFRD